jgi:hypothetical protein
VLSLAVEREELERADAFVAEIPFATRSLTGDTSEQLSRCTSALADAVKRISGTRMAGKGTSIIAPQILSMIFR